jgi:hypothetical protein
LSASISASSCSLVLVSSPSLTRCTSYASIQGYVVPV